MAASPINAARAAFVRDRPVCSKHLQGMVIRRGYVPTKGHVFFWACQHYPSCKPTKPLSVGELERFGPFLPRSGT